MGKKNFLLGMLISLVLLTGCGKDRRNIPWGSNLMHREPTTPELNLNYMTTVQTTVDNMLRELLPESILDENAE